MRAPLDNVSAEWRGDASTFLYLPLKFTRPALSPESAAPPTSAFPLPPRRGGIRSDALRVAKTPSVAASPR